MPKDTFAFNHAFIILLLCSLFISCGAENAKPKTMLPSDLPTQQTLYENYYKQNNMLIIFGDQDTLNKAYVNSYIEDLKKYSEEFIFQVKTISQVSDSDLINHALYFIGTVNDFPVLQTINENLFPVKMQQDKFIFDERLFSKKEDLFKLSFYPSPFNKELPMSIISGNDASEIHTYLEKTMDQSWGYFFWESWGYQIYQNNQRVMLGNFSTDSNSLWLLDKKQHWTFDFIGKEVGENSIFKFIDHASNLSKQQIDSLIETTQLSSGKLLSYKNALLNEKIAYHLYPSIETKGLMLNNTEPVQIDYENSAVHAVNTGAFENYPSGIENRILLRSLFGKPKISALEVGTASLFISTNVNQGFAYYGAQLYKNNCLPSLSEILNEESFNQHSTLLMQACASLFCSWLMQEKYKENYFEIYTSITEQSLLQLENEYIQFLETSTSSINFKQINSFIPSKIHGFNFAHEGYAIYNGYGGSTAITALEKMHEIGTNAISIIPYTGTRNHNIPAPFRIMKGAGGETDEAVVHSIYEARKLGMSVMLKPQVWSNTGWNGDMQLKTEQDWKQFFHFYQEWILHYALLAEIFKADILCVGVEFQSATTSHEKEWRDLFQKVKSIYSGKITYAANWGYEFETVTFWDELDFISVNCYYPLSNLEQVSDETLNAAMEKNLDQIESIQKKYQMPLLITEIGFKSIDYPWIKPHEDADEQGVNQQSQKRCYTAMFKALEDEDWIQGIYLWQWPTYMSYIEENPKGFTPCGKLAQEVVHTYFKK